LCSTRVGVRVDVPAGVAVDAGVYGVTGCGGGGEDLVAADVVAEECSAEVGGGSGTGVDMLGRSELPTPLAPSKWTYLTVKLSYVGVESSSTALSHAHPRPSSNTTSRVVRTRCPWVKDAVGLRALCVADEHSRSAPVNMQTSQNCSTWSKLDRPRTIPLALSCIRALK
jgi:hypothetical protein